MGFKEAGKRFIRWLKGYGCRKMRDHRDDFIRCYDSVSAKLSEEALNGLKDEYKQSTGNEMPQIMQDWCSRGVNLGIAKGRTYTIGWYDKLIKKICEK